MAVVGPTNDPEELNAIGSRQGCCVMCHVCGKSTCQVQSHQRFVCLCGHRRIEHVSLHPHACNGDYRSCKCEGLMFATVRDALEDLATIMLAIEARPGDESRWL